MRYTHQLAIFIILVFLFSLVTPALALKADKRIGSTFRSKSVEITNIRSTKKDKLQNGLSWYSFRAKVRNRTKRPIKISVIFSGVDRDGQEIQDLRFRDKTIKANNSIDLKDRTIMETRDYNQIYEWKVEKVTVKRL